MARGNKHQNSGDHALEAARYRDARAAADTPVPVDEYAQAAGRTLGGNGVVRETAPHVFHESDDVWEVADNAIDAAMARGEFDNLAYAGKPIPGLGGADDPDWWIKGLLRRENVSGLGPPALMLRTEDAQLEATLDAEGSEARVRAVLEDFNARIIEARRQLMGGPPVVTPLRDIDAELGAWRSRAESRRAEAQPGSEQADSEPPEPGAAKRGRVARLFRRR
ncbi:hypothetical protein QO003_003652 [Arthrobacter silviterrae]|uniref:DUF1992 domain-containing protein n=1 Tax=Arthrobacter silviterrae TaxID=2026658 RepID=A0ABX0DCJ5_9MICC|nr:MULTISPECIES: DUF1992 domain-containing protein [Arthrobacter]MCU6482695.1 DUF1992 domain-containing protein [Arthrobacter sp. A2-55]MDQ0279349.1 hypothetical protein [Arthrobacter silviterrae]NGN83451.1 DUF1992 domain-containing protein [Arthrobacter silviterrae]